MAEGWKNWFEIKRDSGARGILTYCADYRCSHSIAISADGWPDDARLSDIETRFVCQACVWVKRRLYS